MTAAATLLAYAALLGILGPRLMRARGWADRAPRLGVLAWQTAGASVMAAVVLAGLMRVVPIVRTPHGLAACPDATAVSC